MGRRSKFPPPPPPQPPPPPRPPPRGRPPPPPPSPPPPPTCSRVCQANRSAMEKQERDRAAAAAWAAAAWAAARLLPRRRRPRLAARALDEASAPGSASARAADPAHAADPARARSSRIGRTQNPRVSPRVCAHSPTEILRLGGAPPAGPRTGRRATRWPCEQAYVGDSCWAGLMHVPLTRSAYCSFIWAGRMLVCV